MASFITAGNATNGLQVSSDNTGILELRTGTGSGTTAVTIGATQNATFAGSVGVGTSSPAVTLHAVNTSGGGVSGANPSGEVSRIQQTPSFGSGGFVAQRLFLNKTSTANDGVTQSFEGLAVGGDRYALANIGGYIDNAGSGNSVSGYFAILTKPTNASITERARITSGGDFLIGTTTLPASGGTTGFGVNVDASRGQISLRASTTGTTFLAAFYNPNGNVGAITTTGSATSYVTSSDYRLKENIQPMTGALATVSALKPCTYTWKSDGSAGQGFVAHELQEVVPDCVTGEKDAVNADGNPQYQGVDTSFLVATLTAAIQELNAKVEAQAAEIAALKGNA